MTSAAAQEALLDALDKFVSQPEATAHLAKVAFVLKDLYDEDLVEEETLMQWHASSKGNSEVKAKAAPFIKWLKYADCTLHAMCIPPQLT